MKTKLQKATYWASVSVIGIVIGISLQFVKAWTEPSQQAPNSNVGAPLTTGIMGQTKSGGLMINTGGAPIGFLVPNGNVGIGTVSPTQKLTVNGTIESTLGGIKFPDGTVQATAAGVGGGDNLGNHTATQDLNMNGKNISNANGVSAAYFADKNDSNYFVDPSNVSRLNSLQTKDFISGAPITPIGLGSTFPATATCTYREAWYSWAKWKTATLSSNGGSPYIDNNKLVIRYSGYANIDFGNGCYEGYVWVTYDGSSFSNNQCNVDFSPSCFQPVNGQ